MKTTSIRLNQNDLAVLRQIEKENGATPAAQIRVAIARYVEQWEKKVPQ